MTHHSANLCNKHRQRHHSISIFPLFYASNHIENDDGLDAFIEELEELFEESDVRSTSVTNGDVPPHFIEGKTSVGIGGKDGYVYDVNALKRNLVQESVRGCKQELLVLLGGGGRQKQDDISKKSSEYANQRIIVPRWRRDRDDLIEDRLSALVQVCLSKKSLVLYQVVFERIIPKNF